MIHLTVNNRPVSVPGGTTILDAAKKLGINIPTLCYLNLHDINYVNETASCRVCMVEVEGFKKLFPACATPVTQNMRVHTDTAKTIQARRHIIELLLSDHPNSCLTCAKSMNCELQKLANDLGIRKLHYNGEMSSHPVDSDSLSILKDPNKCILCQRCKTICNEVQTVGALATIGRGFNTYVGSVFDRPMHETTCTFCGQCVAVCPTGALTEMNNIGQVWNLINDKTKTVVVQTAPAVRVALGEEFGLEPGAVVTGKMVNALRRIGFAKVFDTNFAADVTIVEEASEFVHRFKNGGKLPMLTSCCPGWVNFFENQFPDLLNIPSSCKSPHEMFGAITKHYLAAKMGVKKEDMILVSVMPCVAKKFEAARPELAERGTRDVDAVITTRELAIMIKEMGINFDALDENDDFDNPLGESSGAGTIFGVTGGVIEAALRTAYEWMTGKELEKMEFEDLRGLKGIKKAQIDIGGEKVRIGVVSGLGNARRLLEKIRSGEEQFHAVEIMACPGGCIAGGGQPYHHGKLDILEKRADALYSEDEKKVIRQSHKNLSVQKIYEEFLGDIYGESAHFYLHTHYKANPRY